ncbi:MAG: hypothetical protein M3O31_09535 [Acidobacteriota bacterium]|nr:hypothetical protein [Acidobacteriota bacterium]
MRVFLSSAAVAILCVFPAVTMAQADPHTMKAIAKVDLRYQSYNVEMVEVIGGRFWRPYSATPIKDLPALETLGVAGVDPNLFEQLPPADLTSPRLRKLAAALGPAYIRVSGSWANTVYFQDSDAPAPAKPPSGYAGVLTRAEWKGVIDFAKAVDAKIVTSFSVGEGARDANGAWVPGQTEAFLRYTRQAGGSIAAAEFFNEPTIPAVAGVPASYDAAAYGRDFKTFVPIFRASAPGALLLGPSGTAEGSGSPSRMKVLPSEDLLKATGTGDLDVFSYHVYPAISERCAARSPVKIGVSPDEALTIEFLRRTDNVEEFYAKLRDKAALGKPIWLSETGEAACGGDRWASTYLDTFRYLYQLGTLATRNVQVVMHNTLAASDYALIDGRTLTPRPNYWAALLWHHLMGTTVLDAGAAPSQKLEIFAQCTAGQPGKVTLLAINLDKDHAQSLALAEGSERYSLTSDELQERTVKLNGKTLMLTADGDLPKIEGLATSLGPAALAPLSISFFVVNANNSMCKQ